MTISQQYTIQMLQLCLFIFLTTIISSSSSSSSSTCDGYYCHYATSVHDRVSSFYDLHAPENKTAEKVARLVEAYGDHEDVLFSELRGKYIRSLLAHSYDHVPLAPPFPRVSIEQLESDDPKFAPYRRGARVFVLVGAANGWKALERWKDLAYLANLYPDAVVDFYPYNMLEGGEKPFLWRLRPALLNQLTQPGSFEDASSKRYYPGRYLHLQLTQKMFTQLRSRGDLSPLPKWFNQDKWWMRRCLHDDTIDEYHIKTHWQIILTGTRGAGMFNHSDSLMTSSWHTHITGRKWWIVCGRNEKDGPRSGEWVCYEDIMRPGDTLYYPRGFFHQTQNIDTTSTTVTGTVVNSHNWDSIAERLFSECSRDALNFDFSSKLCDDLDQCYEVWRRRFTGHEHAERMFRPWREVATKAVIEKKEKMTPTENNYDGRNFIGSK